MNVEPAWAVILAAEMAKKHKVSPVAVLLAAPPFVAKALAEAKGQPEDL